MKMCAFASRVTKEIIRDPLNLAFGLGFPLVLILLLSAIQANIPVPLFEIASLAPGITVFGLSFMALFSAVLLSKDRESAFLQRLYTTPLTPFDYILGYTAPMLPMALIQSAITYIVAIILGLDVKWTIIPAIIFNIPISLFFISLGLICGSLLSSKQVGGICGALLTNLSAWLSGIWFDLELVGGAFKSVADFLPFSHAVELAKAAYSGNFADIIPHIWWVLGYTVITTVLSVLLFLRQMKKQ